MKFFSCRLLVLRPVFITLTVSYFLFGNIVTEADSSPINLPSNLNEKRQLLSTFRHLITELESQGPIPRQDDDDDEKRPGFPDTFPGVANIILGAVTGDLRRVIEDGAFSFLGKEAKEHVFSIYHNLLGRTTKATTVKTTTTKPTTVTVDPEAISAQGARSTNKPPLKYHSANSKATQKVTKSTTPTPEVEDEDELAAKFEEIIRPYLPENPDDVIIKETNYPRL